jgi:uncharacterized protein (TIGR02271 family)
MRQTIIGIFDSAAEANNAVERLTANGYDRDMIDVSINNRTSTDEVVSRDRTDDDDTFGEKVSRFFRNLFDDDDETNKYTDVARRGGAIVTVHADSKDKAEDASEILNSCGAIDVDERSREYSQSNRSYSETSENRISDDSDVDLTSRDRDIDIDRNRRIPIIEEELQVGKREVERGGVKIRSRIVEKPVEETVRLREERLTVDRQPVNRPAADGDLQTFREGEIDVRQHAEVPVVNKEVRVVEEINLNKDVVEREETIRDTVRRTEVDIDDTTDTDVDDDIKTRRRSKDDL